MKASAHQPVFLPWLGTIHKMALCDVWIDFDDVMPDGTGGYENRVMVLSPEGQRWLTVPVLKSRETKIKDLRIANDQPWARKHMRTLELAYFKAPRWKEHEPFLRRTYARKWERLVDLNDEMLRYLCEQFSIVPGKRYKLSALGLTSRKSQLVLDACKAVGATSYLFGAMGKDYADAGAFRAAGVAPLIQEYVPIEYPQAQKGWTPGLSALDVLMNMSNKRAREVMLGGGTITEMA